MTGDGSDTTLTMSVTPASENAIQVYLDGVYQHKDTFSFSGTTLTFSTAPPSGAKVEVINISTVSSSTTPGDGTVTSAKLATSLDLTGVMTASTFEPDGDTAAGDNAAIGYTSAEGLILTGQGSSTDVTIKNDADTTVMSIATGTTQATFAGEVVAASLDISGNIDVDGTTNLDAVDIDGAVQLDSTLTVGVDDTGYDVKFFGATAGKYMEWDESADQLDVTGSLDVTGDASVTGTLQLKNGATSAGKIEFYEDSDNGTNKVTLIGPASTADITLTLPSSDGDSGQSLITDGSGNLSFSTIGGAYNDWNVISSGSSHTATSKDQLVILSASAFTVTLPAGSVNDSVTIHNAGAGTVTIASNGSEKIESSTDNGTLFTDDTTQLVYVSSTIGWKEMNV